jgi:hypothetical protein
MSEGRSIVAEVVSFDPVGFADHNASGFTRFPAALLHIDQPVEMRGMNLTFVLDHHVIGDELLTVPGTRVGMLLDPESEGLDPIFAGALVDGRVHRFDMEES